MAYRIDDDENRIQDLTDKIDQLEVQTFSPEVVARNESTRNTGIETGDGAATNPYPEWYPVRDFGTLGNLTLQILLNRTDSQIAKMTLNGDVDFAFSSPPPLNKGMWFILDVTIDNVGGHTINLPPNVLPASTTIDNTADARTVLRITTTDGGTTYYAENIETGGGGTVGTFISADLTADQITNLAVNDHIEFDRNTTPTGADGGIVLQTGAGQANGIFELKAGKTYFLSAGVAPFFGATNHVEFVWFDITNTTELGRRTIQDDAVLALDQPKAEISFTPLTDVNVEFRLVANTTPANLNGYDADHTFANIFEFSGRNGADGAPGTGGSISFKDPVRAKTLVDVPSLAAFNVVTDGVTLIEDDRVLLTEQTSASENGIYTVGVVTTGTAPLTRSQDMDVSSELVASIIVMVEEGTTKENTMWQLISNNPLTIGVTDQVWAEFRSGGQGAPGTVGNDGLDASGVFVLDGRQYAAFDRLKRVQQYWNVRGPQGQTGDMFLIPNDGYNHGDFGGPPPPPTELNPQEVLVTVGARDAIGGGQTSSSFSLNYGLNWTALSDLPDELWGNIIYDPVGRVLLCFASFTGASANVGRSVDKGQGWGSSLASLGGAPQDAIWVSSLSLFVVVNNSITGNSIATSPDGSTWTIRSTPAANPVAPAIAARWRLIEFSPHLGKIFVVGNGTDDVLTSTDGINWSVEAAKLDVDGVDEFPVSIKKMVWSNGQRKFIIIPTSNIDTNGLWQSIDGINWINNSVNLGFANDILFMEDLGTWLIGGGGPSGHPVPTVFGISVDGINWTPMPPKEFRNIEFDAGELVSSSPVAPNGIAYSDSFGYIFGFGGSQNFIANNFEENRFYRTEVHFNEHASANTTERDITNPH